MSGFRGFCGVVLSWERRVAFWALRFILWDFFSVDMG